MGRREPEILDDVPEPDEQQAHDALVNWAEWCRRVGGGGGSCRSFEKNYRSPPGLEGRGAPRVQVQDLRAELVNSRMLRLPPDYAEALRRRYYNRQSPRAIARLCGLNARRYPSYMRACRLALAEALLG